MRWFEPRHVAPGDNDTTPALLLEAEGAAMINKTLLVLTDMQLFLPS